MLNTENTKIIVIYGGELSQSNTLGDVVACARRVLEKSCIDDGLGSPLYLTEDGRLVTIEAAIEVTQVTPELAEDLFEDSLTDYDNYFC